MRYIATIMLMVAVASAGYIHPQLEEILNTLEPNEPIQVVVHMKEQADLSVLPEATSKADKIIYLQEFSALYQADLLGWLELHRDKISNLNTWWIFNGMTFKAPRHIIEAVAERSDVDYIIDDFLVYLHDTKAGAVIDETRAPTWNITRVKADSCWLAGYTGSGVIVGNMDTGVLVTHAALNGKWVTGGWYDAVNGNPNPYDDNGHGTHTMGTICGGDGTGPFANDIGVAPGANFIAAKCFPASGGGQNSWIHNSFQWFATQNAKVVNNSWGSASTTSQEFWPDIANWRSLGIYPAFSIGNNGPSAGTAGTPGNYPICTGTGATTSGDVIASFSSRGPAPNQSPWTNPANWARPDWNRTKPDISAPGVNVPSSYNNGGYANMDGTSMACPHVTGAVALCLQKNPTLDYATLYNILLDNADEPSGGGPYPNNNYGWGRLNCYAALNAVPVGSAPIISLNRTAVVGGNGNGRLDPGESAGIVAYLRNTGNSAATNTNGTLRTSDSYITITDSTSNFGTIAAGDSANNSADPFDVTVSGSCPVGHTVDFDLYVVCAESSWTFPFSLLVGDPGLDWASHNCGNVVFSVTRYGALGFMTSAGTQGEGFKYPAAGANHLFCGSFASGNSANYCVDRYFESGSVDDVDWETTPSGMVQVFEPGPDNRDEFFIAQYTDSGHATPQGLVCDQESWAWDDPTADDFVIMKFILRNTGSSALNNMYAAIFIDWDIGTATANQGNSETARNIVWMNSATTYCGVEILDPPRATPAANLSLVDHAIYVYPYNGLPDSIQFKFMDGTYSSPASNRPYDWSIANSAGPFNIPAGGAVVAAFAIIGANNQANLQTYADTAYNRYWNWPGVSEIPGSGKVSAVRLYPAVSMGKPYTIEYGFTKKTPVTANVFDVAGRIVATKEYGVVNGSGKLKLDLESLSQGIYFVNVKTDETTTNHKILWLK